MKMIEHVGTVVAIEGDKAVVELQSGQACDTGPLGGRLAACGCCAGERPERRLYVERAGLEAGDAVQVSTPAYAGYVLALAAYGLPLAGFVAGLIVGGQFEPAGGANDTATIAGGLAGLAVAGAAAVLVVRLLNKGRSRPQVRRVDSGPVRGT